MNYGNNIGPNSPGQYRRPRRAADFCQDIIGPIPFRQASDFNVNLTAATSISSTSPVSQYKYCGKEWNPTSLSYDFGARNYLPAVPRWNSMDPLAEKYYSISPYVYCAGNPVNLVDKDGKSTKVKRNEDGTYKVIGGDIHDGDLNIYVYLEGENGEYTPTGESIGETPTSTSFYNTDTDSWETDAIINLENTTGAEFINYVVDSDISLLGYMINAVPNGIFDFKKTEGSFVVKYTETSDYYRGMPIGKNKNGKVIIASARDVGNLVAGYVAGLHGFSWTSSRIAFDGLETIQHGGIKSKEGDSSVNAQKYGWSIGNKKYHRTGKVSHNKGWERIL